MIGLLPTTTIFLATAPTDLRKAYDGLAVLVRQSMGVISRQPVRAHQRMRQPPGAAFELAKRLGHPSRQHQIIEVAKHGFVFLPEPIERIVRYVRHLTGNLSSPPQSSKPKVAKRATGTGHDRGPPRASWWRPGTAPPTPNSFRVSTSGFRILPC
jgi:hypothetical protein